MWLIKYKKLITKPPEKTLTILRMMSIKLYKHFICGHSACKNILLKQICSLLNQVILQNATQTTTVSSNISVQSQATSANKHSNTSNADAEQDVKAPDDNCL